MIIRNAIQSDINNIADNDKWIEREVLEKKIDDNEVYVAYNGTDFIGWLRYGFFWDNTPFMNMLHLLTPYQKQGIGKQFVLHWENEMAQKGYKVLLTSTAQVEYAQHFYTKLGYNAIGGFTLEGEPLEIIFAKYV